MPDPISTWSHYQSLIQLSVGVNFVFGLFDAIVAPRLDRLSERRKTLLAEIAANPDKRVSAEKIDSATKSIRKSSDFVRGMTAFGVYPSIVSAIVATVLLILSTEHPGTEAGPGWQAAVYGTYLWQAIFLSIFLVRMLSIEIKLQRIR